MTTDKTNGRRSVLPARHFLQRDPRLASGEGKPLRVLQSKILALRLSESIGRTVPAGGNARSLAHSGAHHVQNPGAHHVHNEAI